ncbi:hypothetical protein [Leptolyngbya sp. NIES-2104]|uniref:hypothetical protein n=1 Tax=Leptolyngbya sp. NIES-2104 TaxID=1552121 RepID=UPI0012E38153|nr:hypothetical protein [Leptolyngbya sp. NIES-2104]
MLTFLKPPMLVVSALGVSRSKSLVASLGGAIFGLVVWASDRIAHDDLVQNSSGFIWSRQAKFRSCRKFGMYDRISKLYRHNASDE